MENRVVYLFGAGASHACVKRVGSRHGILTSDLMVPIQQRLGELITNGNGFSNNPRLTDLVNSMNEYTEIEHLITFMDDIPSIQHREFANEMRIAFEEALRNKLQLIREETPGDPIELYEALLDMHNVEQFPEVLQGIITLNYDEYIETAIEHVWDGQVDFGIQLEGSSQQYAPPRLLKLHGSFGWQDTLPISKANNGGATLWIPPGIQKSKQAYPFNMLWGAAREMLACDILRVVGCRLGPNDWDLISLLFTMRHSGKGQRPRIEIINSPAQAMELKKSYEYLDLLSILEIEHLGGIFISEITSRPDKEFDDFDEEEREDILRSFNEKPQNWFQFWLTRKIDMHSIDLGPMFTVKGYVGKLLNARG